MSESERIINLIIDYEIRGSLGKVFIQWMPKLAARYYTWKTKKKFARWRRSHE